MKRVLYAIVLMLLLWLTASATVTYTYDAAGHLTAINYGNGSVVTYTYDNAGNLVSRSVTATLTAQTILFAALPNLPFGSAPFTVSATASSGLPVSFGSLTTSICTTTGTNGTTVTLVPSALGQCTIQASQAGNSTYAAAPSVNQSFQITLASQSISFAALPNLPLGSAPFTVSATATSGLPVSFGSLTTSVCTVSGATVTLVPNAVGTCTIQATQLGNTDYTPAASVNQSFQVTSLPQLVVTRSLSRNAGVISVIVTVTNSGGSAASNVQLTVAKIGTTSTTNSLPVTVGTGTIAGGGGAAQVTVTFPGTVGTTGTSTTLVLDGTYAGGGSFGGTARVTLP